MGKSKRTALIVTSLLIMSLFVAASFAVDCGRCGDWAKCCSGVTDDNGDGWGWEDSQSCIVPGSQPQHEHCPFAGGCAGYPYCSSASLDNGGGWGWENSQTCIVSGTAAEAEKCGGGSGPHLPHPPPPPSSGQCPPSLPCPAGYGCGCYLVPGLGARKQALQTVGADATFLASAMMETEYMNTNYPYGDHKTGDAFNAGLAKQNWFLSKRCHAPWVGKAANEYATMAVLNSDSRLDIQVYHECRAMFPGRKFFASHRNGETGFNNPYTGDIDRFIESYEWTLAHVGGHMNDDTRFWVQIPAI